MEDAFTPIAQYGFVPETNSCAVKIIMHNCLFHNRAQIHNMSYKTKSIVWIKMYAKWLQSVDKR